MEQEKNEMMKNEETVRQCERWIEETVNKQTEVWEMTKAGKALWTTDRQTNYYWHTISDWFYKKLKYLVSCYQLKPTVGWGFHGSTQFSGKTQTWNQDLSLLILIRLVCVSGIMCNTQGDPNVTEFMHYPVSFEVFGRWRSVWLCSDDGTGTELTLNQSVSDWIYGIHLFWGFEQL